MKIKVSNVNTPNWKEVTVKSRIPAELEKLSEISRNIWWAWNFEATELFRDLDPELWKECGQNPVLLLERMSYEKLEALAKDKVILRRMNEVYTKFRDYMDVKPDEQRPSIAYFSMEYGLSSVLKIYSGGLGVLAGDYLKEASDSNVDLCAVGFLYRYGYFTQKFSAAGNQEAEYEAQDFTKKESTYYGDQIPYIPWHSGSLILNGTYKSWFLNYSFIYTGKRYEASANIPENRAKEWYTSDFSLSKNFSWRKTVIRLTAEVNNIFNQQYEVVQCYPMPGTNVKFIINIEI